MTFFSILILDLPTVTDRDFSRQLVSLVGQNLTTDWDGVRWSRINLNEAVVLGGAVRSGRQRDEMGTGLAEPDWARSSRVGSDWVGSGWVGLSRFWSGPAPTVSCT